MTTIYDGIILGAGHNGMILQAYLGMAGLKTVAIERRPVAGGGLSTLEDPRHPGFLHRSNGGPTSAGPSHRSRASAAETLQRWHDEFVPIVRDILTPEGRSPPLPPAERAPS
jgi:phytoene dehydrogenase-like protein